MKNILLFPNLVDWTSARASPSFGAETTTQATAEQTQVAAAIESSLKLWLSNNHDGIEVEKRQKPHRVFVPFGAASKKMFR